MSRVPGARVRIRLAGARPWRPGPRGRLGPAAEGPPVGESWRRYPRSSPGLLQRAPKNGIRASVLQRMLALTWCFSVGVAGLSAACGSLASERGSKRHSRTFRSTCSAPGTLPWAARWAWERVSTSSAPASTAARASPGCKRRSRLLALARILSMERPQLAAVGSCPEPARAAAPRSPSVVDDVAAAGSAVVRLRLQRRLFFRTRRAE